MPMSDNLLVVEIKRVVNFAITAASCTSCKFRERQDCIRNPDITFKITDNNYCDRWKNKSEDKS